MLSKDISSIKKILIVGDSGRGKSTLAKSLSQKLKIRHYSTDDFYWKTKFSIPEDKQVSIKNICKIYSRASWIIEGSTRSLIKEGLGKSDIIFYLIYPNLLSQFWSLLRRKLTRKEEHWINLLRLYKHLIQKRYKIGPQKNKLRLNEMIDPFKNKTTELHSFNEINQLLKKI